MSEVQQILALSRRALARGERLCLATVVHVEGSAYRKPGARMLLASGGERAGTISGGCLEAEVSRKAWWLTAQGPRLQRYASFADEDGSMPYGLGCGGTISVLLEQGDAVLSVLYALERGLASQQPGVIVTALESTSGDLPTQRIVPAGTLAVFSLASDGARLRGSRSGVGVPGGAVPGVGFVSGSSVPVRSIPGSSVCGTAILGLASEDAAFQDATPGGTVPASVPGSTLNGAQVAHPNDQPARDFGLTGLLYLRQPLLSDGAEQARAPEQESEFLAALSDAVRQALVEQRSSFRTLSWTSASRSSPSLLDTDPALPAYFVEYLAPPPALTIFGAGDDAQPIASFAHALGWRVTVADGRAHLARPDRFPLAASVQVLDYADPALRAACGISDQAPGSTWQPPVPEAASNLYADPLSVILTHSYEQDRALLAALLPRKLTYLGILGPRHRTERLLGEVAPALGLTLEEAFAQLHSPIGLDLGTGDPASVALSIIAEIQATLHSRQVTIHRLSRFPIEPAAPFPSAAAGSTASAESVSEAAVASSADRPLPLVEALRE